MPNFLSYATLVTFIPLLGTKLFQLRQRGIFGRIMEENEDVWFHTKKQYEIGQKYPSTITEITLSPKEVARSPGWHMKDNKHTYLFVPHLFFDNKYNLGARLDQIRSNGIVTVVWGHYAKRARPIWLKISGNTYLATKLKCH